MPELGNYYYMFSWVGVKSSWIFLFQDSIIELLSLVGGNDVIMQRSKHSIHIFDKQNQVFPLSQAPEKDTNGSVQLISQSNVAWAALPHTGLKHITPQEQK